MQNLPSVWFSLTLAESIEQPANHSSPVRHNYIAMLQKTKQPHQQQQRPVSAWSDEAAPTQVGTKSGKKKGRWGTASLWHKGKSKNTQVEVISPPQSSRPVLKSWLNRRGSVSLNDGLAQLHVAGSSDDSSENDIVLWQNHKNGEEGDNSTPNITILSSSGEDSLNISEPAKRPMSDRKTTKKESNHKKKFSKRGKHRKTSISSASTAPVINMDNVEDFLEGIPWRSELEYSPIVDGDAISLDGKLNMFQLVNLGSHPQLRLVTLMIDIRSYEQFEQTKIIGSRHVSEFGSNNRPKRSRIRDLGEFKILVWIVDDDETELHCEIDIDDDHSKATEFVKLHTFWFPFFTSKVAEEAPYVLLGLQNSDWPPITLLSHGELILCAEKSHDWLIRLAPLVDVTVLMSDANGENINHHPATKCYNNVISVLSQDLMVSHKTTVIWDTGLMKLLEQLHNHGRCRSVLLLLSGSSSPGVVVESDLWPLLLVATSLLMVRRHWRQHQAQRYLQFVRSVFAPPLPPSAAQTLLNLERTLFSASTPASGSSSSASKKIHRQEFAFMLGN